MSSQKPNYSLTPPRPYSPSGPIRLGTIIKSPLKPDDPRLQPDLPPLNDVSVFTEHKRSASHSSKTSSRNGVWTCFLEMIVGAGVDASVRLDKEMTQRWTVESMIIMNFHPSEKYFADAVCHDDVRN